MRIKSLVITASITLFFLVVPHTVAAQEDGEAQAVIFDAHNRAILKFSDKGEKRPDCGFFVSYTLMENQEEAFVVRVIHMHSLPEKGWLYITPSRVVFRVVIGDRSHAFDIPRTSLKDKPGTNAGSGYAGIQLNLKERLPATGSKEQKFGSSVTGDKSCYPHDPSRFNKFLERTVNDFTGAMTEFQQTTASLKQAGKIQQQAAVGATSSQSELSADGVYQATLSLMILDMGMPERAREKAKEALRLLASHKEDFQFYWATAVANYVLSNYDVAIANSNKALQLDPEHSGAYMCRGQSYFFKKDYQLALVDFDKVIELTPKFATAHLYRGLTHYDKNDYDRAIADFDKAIELNPKATTAYIFRGSAYSQKGDNNRAIAEYSEVIRMQPDFVQAYQLRAIAYEKIGDKVKAQADRDKAAELGKQSAKP